MCALWALLWWGLFVTGTDRSTAHAGAEPGVAPRFVIHPRGLILQAGQRRVLHCAAVGEPRPQLRLLRNGQALSNWTKSPLIHPVEGTLDQEGTYSCIAHNDVGTVLSYAARITVAFLRVIEEEPKTIQVAEGATVILELPDVESAPPATAVWSRLDGSHLEGIQYASTKDGRLVILGVRPRDAAPYQVVLTNTYTGESISGPIIHLAVTGKAEEFGSRLEMVIAPSNRTFDISSDGQSYTLECIVRGWPQEDVETVWMKDGGPLRGRHVLTSWNRTLTVLDVEALGSGNVTCKASLRSHPETHPIIHSATVTLAAQPTLEHKVAEETAAELGQAVILPCSAVGMPMPQVKWLRNALPLHNSIHFVQLGNASLLIEALAAEDAGVFQCIASNELGEVVATTWLHIKISPPSFMRPPENITVLDGMDAQLTCGVVGSPTPNTTWLYNGVVPLQNEGHVQIMDSGNLLLSSVTVGDGGEYSCTRMNSAGAVSASAHLTVLVRTQIVQPPVDTRVILGSTAELQCKVSHDPSVPFTVRWLPEGITSSRISVSLDGTLRIEQARNTDIGNYTCVVTSPGGNDTRSARLQVIELPHPPTNVLATVQDTMPKTVRVSWSPAFDGNSPISHFILQMRSLSNVVVDSLAPWTTVHSNISASATSALVPQLNPSVSYQFRVSAVNGVGEGTASEATQPISVPPEPPGGPPQGVVGAARSSTSIMLQWQPPLEGERNGQLLGYTVRYKLAGYAPVPWATLNVTATTALLSDLIVWQTYAIQVAAFNEKGLGVFSDPITVRTREGVPRAAPTDVKTHSINSTSVHVQWRPPDPQLIDGLNQGYKVEAWDEGKVQRVVLVPPSSAAPLEEHTAVVSGLRKYRNYNITVLCFTSPGDGPRSSPVPVTTKQDVPGPVLWLKFEDILDISTIVLWAPPEDVNGILLGYTLRYWIKDNPGSTIVRNVSADTVREYVGGLQPVTFYVFEVFAWTVIGAGPALSATIQSGIPPVLPGAPRRLAVSNIAAFSVVLQFTPGFDGNSSITKWTVEAQTRRSERWSICFQQENAPEAQALTVQPLVPYTEYRLRLTASNVVGESPASEPSHWFQTLQAAPGHAPRNVTVRAAGPHSLRVRWTPLPQGEWHGVPRGYNVSYRTTGEEEFSWLVVEDHNANSFVLDQLHAFTQYEVFMQAINDVGASASSALAAERTREYIPTSGPSHVVANATSSTTVVVSWMDVPFEHRNGIIEGYRVVYRAAKASSTTQRNIEGNTTFAATLTELRKYTQYTVQVLAFTRVGDGALSVPPVTVTTFQDVPGPPSNVSFPDVTTTTARIIWDVPEEPNGEITAYRIAYWPNGTVSLRVERQVSPLDRTLKAFDLTPQTFYMFVVSAQTHEGWGLEARALVLTTAHREKPSAPSRPLVSPSQVQARQMTFSWTPGRDGFAPLRYYLLQLIEGGSPWRDVGKVEPGATTHTAVGLKPATRYQFRLRALNDLGASPWSEPSHEVSTHPAAPGQPPSGIVVTPYTTTSITVAWKGLPKDAWNGDSLNAGYRVAYCPAGEARDCQSQQLLGHSATTLTIDGLERDRIYEVRVKAFNGQGEGPSSGPIAVYVGEAVPTGRPRQVRLEAQSSTEINVSWSPPLKHESNGDLLGYKIFYWDTSGEEELEAVPAEPTVYTLSGLKKFVNYTVQLLAFNPAGDGPRSEPMTVHTLADKPGPVGVLSFSDIRMTSLNLSWERPEEPNGIITGYLVNYETAELNAESGKEVRQKVLQQHLWVGSLRELATYCFTVRAKTSAGYGPERRRNVTTGPQDGSPMAPLELVLQHSITSATLSWNEGLPGASPITGYLVEARSVPHLGDEWQTIAELPQQLSYTVSFENLVPSTKYEFRLFARNHHGVSLPVYTAEVVETPNKLLLEYRQRLPFHREPWFLVVLASSSMVLIILLIAVLCVKSKAHRYKKEMQESLVLRQESDLLGDGDVAGFGTPSGSMSKRNTRRPPLRSPPRPSPASITYSDEEDAKGYDDHCDSSSITEKPSEISSSESQDSDSDSDNKGDPHSFVNHYANVNDTLRQSWKKQNISKPPSYTDSEQDSAAAVSLNGGKIVLNNMAGSRAPLPGFSSFV